MDTCFIIIGARCTRTNNWTDKVIIVETDETAEHDQYLIRVET